MKANMKIRASGHEALSAGVPSMNIWVAGLGFRV